MGRTAKSSQHQLDHPEKLWFQGQQETAGALSRKSGGRTQGGREREAERGEQRKGRGTGSSQEKGERSPGLKAPISRLPTPNQGPPGSLAGSPRKASPATPPGPCPCSPLPPLQVVGGSGSSHRPPYPLPFVLAPPQCPGENPQPSAQGPSDSRTGCVLVTRGV